MQAVKRRPDASASPVVQAVRVTAAMEPQWVGVALARVVGLPTCEETPELEAWVRAALSPYVAIAGASGYSGCRWLRWLMTCRSCMTRSARGA